MVPMHFKFLSSIAAYFTGNSQSLEGEKLDEGETPNAEIVARWNNLHHVGDFKNIWDLSLVQAGDNLSYILEDRKSTIRLVGAVPCPAQLNIPQLVQVIQQGHLEPVLGSDRTVSFSSRYITWEKTTEIEGQVVRVSCLNHGKKTVWQKHDSLTDFRTYYPIDAIILSSACSKKTRKIFKQYFLSAGGSIQDSKLPKSSWERFTFTNRKIVINKLPNVYNEKFEKRIYTCHYAVTTAKNGTITLQIKEPSREFLSFKDPQPRWETHSNEKSVFWRLRPTIPNTRFIPFFSDNPLGIKLVAADKLKSLLKRITNTYSVTLANQKNIPLFEEPFSAEFKNANIHHLTEDRLEGKANLVLYGQENKKGYGFWSDSNFTVEALEIDFIYPPQFHLPTTYIDGIEIEPVHVPSGFDFNVRLTHFQWGITLITFKGSGGNHALCTVEAPYEEYFNKFTTSATLPLKKGELMRMFFHFTGSEITWKVTPDIQYQTRSQIWLREATIVKKMLDTVHSSYPPPFDWRGSSAVGSDGHSCFTWLKEMLKLAEIEVHGTITDLYAAAATNVTQPIRYYADKPQIAPP